MSAFRYLRDRLFLVSCALYLLNRFVVKPQVGSVFIHGYFNDLLLIPCALPPLLWMHRRAGLRRHDQPPSPGEVLLYLGLWSVLFELVGPRFMPHTVGDLWDVAAYATGGMIALVWWHWPMAPGRMARHEL